MSRKRRGREEGSIYQRGDGLWTASVSLGYDETGKRKRRVVYGKTKTEVQEKLRRLQHDVGRGVDLPPDRLTLGQWLARWLALVKPTVEPNTYGPYERHSRLHLTPRIGNIILNKLAAVHVQGLYADLTAAGVSAALQRKVGTTLTVALNQAVKLDLLPSNPATKVRKPKAARPEIVVFDPEEVALFLASARSDRLYPYYLTALDSGARPGELFALLWDDVDFDGGFWSITKSLEEISGILRVKAVKTPKSRRRIDLSGGTLAVLAECRKVALADGRIGSPVFHDTDGGHLRLSNLMKNSFKPILGRAGLSSVGLYTLRHTCATLLLLANEPAKVVSERLGHSSVTLTLDTYSHVLPAMQKRAADVMGRILGAARRAE
jgi:integrase